MSPLDTIHVTKTARKKRDRYLTPEELKVVLRNRSGYVCRKVSPSHEDLYDKTKFIMRGSFFELDLDIVFTVESNRTVVVTQMSQHTDSLRGHFYEQVGTTAADAVSAVPN
ncbi:hypothetical protein [Natronobacterium gregoryi]|uniref:Uncharacterized protein n=2 Tax=Natronobacterium gregoryi TaxID=44930 RepID=L0AKB6_NATGS|nr:hypothetical protein Natgr_3104 [Natronobacterium gregoryi SP2]ELY63692.1 hypothetical protein C490_15619 [Natronobacterium gregoryi SP2]PLK21978.1 hypothetical protein CYV19_00850 [Natronobacterium gregoryi SP2]SFI52019.1 hypothetical protein SAMN05443661_101123 [Natronobacterium gregoryi]